MNHEEHKDRLDVELRRAINTTTPEFNAEAWQQEYRGEFDTLLMRAHKVRTVRLRPVFWLGVAAAIAIVGYVLVCWTASRRTTALRPATGAKSPAQLVTMSSLSLTYRRGGMEALDKQLDEAVRQLGPRPMSVPTAGLLADLGS